MTREADKKKPLILYHSGCYDGYTAAWVAATALGGEDAVEMQPVVHSRPIKGLHFAQRDVYVVDFSFSRQETLELSALAKKMVVLDHHVTAQKELEPLIGYDENLSLEVHFDMDRSGAGMAWDYFYPNRKRARFVDYVEDRDLWNWALPDSEAVNAYIGMHDFDFSTWTDLVSSFEDHYLAFVERGKRILAYRDRLVRRLVSNAETVTIKGHDVPSVNSAILQSEVGEQLLQENPDAPFACIWCYVRGHYIYSLRSTDDREDVGQIAASLGGGGHRNAAGFRAKGFTLDRLVQDLE